MFAPVWFYKSTKGQHLKVMGGQKTFFCGVLFALGYVGLKFVQSAEGRSSHGEDIFRNICQQIIFVINTKTCLCHVIKPQLYWRQIPETCQLVQDLHSFYQNLLCGTRPKSPLRCFAPGLYIFFHRYQIILRYL